MLDLYLHRNWLALLLCRCVMMAVMSGVKHTVFPPHFVRVPEAMLTSGPGGMTDVTGRFWDDCRGLPTKIQIGTTKAFSYGYSFEYDLQRVHPGDPASQWLYVCSKASETGNGLPTRIQIGTPKAFALGYPFDYALQQVNPGNPGASRGVHASCRVYASCRVQVHVDGFTLRCQAHPLFLSSPYVCMCFGI